METFFLVCFVFGALFTLTSFFLGALGAGLGHGVHLGHGGDAGPAGHFGHAEPVGHGGAAHAPQGPHGLHVPHGPSDATGGEQMGGVVSGHLGFLAQVPIFNLTALLGFLTWFGAAGFVLLRFGTWPLVAVLLVALFAGFVAALLLALFLRKLLEGERVMDPADYRLQGTLARVTVSIPATGVGEIIFIMAGARRSEAARSATGQPLARGTEVVILHHARGVAAVQPWRELLGREPDDHPPPAESTSAPALPTADH
jgi:membrane protein implicated in regulation of membrane protease activity